MRSFLTLCVNLKAGLSKTRGKRNNGGRWGRTCIKDLHSEGDQNLRARAKQGFSLADKTKS